MKHMLSIIMIIILIGASTSQKTVFANQAPDVVEDTIPLGNLIIGIPFEDIESTTDAGSISILFSKIPTGPSTENDQAWSQASSGMAGVSEQDDQFGRSLAAGDFNGDGLQDLAVGVPWEEIDGNIMAGAVHIIYADSPTSFSADGNWLLNQNATGIEGVAESGDFFGTSLAVGDFNDDTYDDLAIGVPGEEISGVVHAGMVNVLYGSVNGLSEVDNETWYQGKDALLSGEAAQDAFFGSAVTVGDYNGDYVDDLAVGVPGYHDAGCVNIIYGSGVTGLTYDGNQVLSIINGISGDNFGYSLASGDLNGDGYDDLAVGVPWRDVDAQNSGEVYVFHGMSSGLWSKSYTHLSQEYYAGENEEGDTFGRSLAAADFDGNGRDDLAIGIPWEDIAGVTNTGKVMAFYFDATWERTGIQSFYQVDDPLDQLGFSLAAGDLTGDGCAELVTGIPFEDINTSDGSKIVDAGVVKVFFGSSSGVRGGYQIFSQDGEIAGVPEEYDNFGHSVAIAMNEVAISKIFLPFVIQY